MRPQTRPVPLFKHCFSRWLAGSGLLTPGACQRGAPGHLPPAVFFGFWSAGPGVCTQPTSAAGRGWEKPRGALLGRQVPSAWHSSSTTPPPPLLPKPSAALHSAAPLPSPSPSSPSRAFVSHRNSHTHTAQVQVNRNDLDLSTAPLGIEWTMPTHSALPPPPAALGSPGLPTFSLLLLRSSFARKPRGRRERLKSPSRTEGGAGGGGLGFGTDSELKTSKKGNFFTLGKVRLSFKRMLLCQLA